MNEQAMMEWRSRVHAFVDEAIACTRERRPFDRARFHQDAVRYEENEQRGDLSLALQENKELRSQVEELAKQLRDRAESVPEPTTEG